MIPISGEIKALSLSVTAKLLILHVLHKHGMSHCVYFFYSYCFSTAKRQYIKTSSCDDVVVEYWNTHNHSSPIPKLAKEEALSLGRKALATSALQTVCSIL